MASFASDTFQFNSEQTRFGTKILHHRIETNVNLVSNFTMLVPGQTSELENGAYTNMRKRCALTRSACAWQNLN